MGWVGYAAYIRDTFARTYICEMPLIIYFTLAYVTHTRAQPLTVRQAAILIYNKSALHFPLLLLLLSLAQLCVGNGVHRMPFT